MATATPGQPIKFKDMTPGQVMMLKDGSFRLKMPDGSHQDFQTHREAKERYKDAFTEFQIQENVRSAERAIRNKLSGLPEAASNIAAAAGRTGARGFSNLTSGLHGMGENTLALATPFARNIRETLPATTPLITGASPQVFASPEFSTPARRLTESTGRAAMGALEMASAPIAAPGGQAIEEMIEGGTEMLGGSPELGSRVGGAANAISQFALPGVGLRTAGTAIRRLPILRQAFMGRTDPVVREVNKGLREIVLEGRGRRFPMQRGQVRKLEESIGEGIKATVSELRDMAGRQLDDAAVAIPGNVRKAAPETRDAVIEALQDLGYTARAGASSPPRLQPGGILAARRRTGVATTTAERQSYRIKNLLGGLTDQEARELSQATGLNPTTLRYIVAEDVSFQTLDQIRKDVGEIAGKSKNPKIRRALGKVIDAVKRDVTNEFSPSFPDATRGYLEALDTFSRQVYPVERFIQSNGVKQIADTVESWGPEKLAGVKAALPPEYVRDLVALTLTRRIDESFNADGVFVAGDLKQKLETLKFQRKITSLLDGDAADRMMGFVQVLEQANRAISATSRLGQFARPYAIFQVVKGNLGGSGAFVIPEVIKRSGRAEAATRLMSAARRESFLPAVEGARSLLMSFEIARQKIEEELKREDQNFPRIPSGTETQESLLGRFREQHRTVDRPPSAPAQP